MSDDSLKEHKHTLKSASLYITRVGGEEEWLAMRWGEMEFDDSPWSPSQ